MRKRGIYKGTFGYFSTKGCYGYSSGSHKSHVWFGLGGTEYQKRKDVEGNKFRPEGYDCGLPKEAFEGDCRNAKDGRDLIKGIEVSPKNSYQCHQECIRQTGCAAFAFNKSETESCNLYAGGPYTDGTGHEDTICYIMEGCIAYSQSACKAAVKKLNLNEGSGSSDFVGDYGTKGCYYYTSGSYKGQAYYGTGGTLQQMAEGLTGKQDRPAGYDCDVSRCVPYSLAACEAALKEQGISKGTQGTYSTKGCYAYGSGKYKGQAYFGTGGTEAQMKTNLEGSVYRPKGYDCAIYEVTGVAQSGKYFDLGAVTESDIKARASNLGVTWSSGKTAKANITAANGSEKGCVDITMWKENIKTSSGTYDGVHGRVEPASAMKAGDWAVGDKIEIVVTCPGNQ